MCTPYNYLHYLYFVVILCVMVIFTGYLWAWLTNKRSDLENKRKQCRVLGTTKKQIYPSFYTVQLEHLSLPYLLTSCHLNLRCSLCSFCSNSSALNPHSPSSPFLSCMHGSNWWCGNTENKVVQQSTYVCRLYQFTLDFVFVLYKYVMSFYVPIFHFRLF